MSDAETRNPGMGKPPMPELPDEAKVALNPYRWITHEKFLEFMRARNVDMTCERCGRDDAWWIDTGAGDGYVPRVAAMPNTDSGSANLNDTFQMPVVRALCVNCGNLRLHALFAMQTWRANGYSNEPVVFSQAPSEGSK